MAQTCTRSMRTMVLMAICVVCFLFALPCIGFGVLGLLGVLADVGGEENHRIGVQSLWLSLIPVSLGVIALILAVVSWMRGTSVSRAGAAANSNRPATTPVSGS